MKIPQLITNLKSVAADAQAIFTSGNISYTHGDTYAIADAWVEEGSGDIDIIACNIYKGGSEDDYGLSYQGRITDLVDAWGAGHTYLTEFGPSYTSLADYSSDETIQAEAVSEMLNYIKASGITEHFSLH